MTMVGRWQSVVYGLHGGCNSVSLRFTVDSDRDVSRLGKSLDIDKQK